VLHFWQPVEVSLISAVRRSQGRTLLRRNSSACGVFNIAGFWIGRTGVGDSATFARLATSKPAKANSRSIRMMLPFPVLNICLSNKLADRTTDPRYVATTW
jgi:hypothetical protein